ncbi:MAG TPA: PKD domain-containing protein, partial [Solirubrobacterales bacterium]
ERFDGTDFVVQASQRPAGGEFAAPDDLSALGESSGFPRVAMTSAGEAIALWMRVEGEDTFVQASIRPPGGEFSAPDDLSPVQSPAFGGTAQLATNADGDALAVWSARGSGEQVVAASIRPAGGGFSSPIEISPTATVPLRPFGAIGKTGDAVAVWGRSNGAHDIVQAAGYDVDPPALGNLSIPATGTVGEPVSFSVTPFDVWPGVATSFSFGDGAGAPGAAVSHTYGAPGSYRVTATASDAVGSASESGVISISPSYEFRIGKHKRNRKRGTVLLTVHISGPGRVTVAGRLVKRRQRRRASAGPVRVPVIAKGRALKRLRKKGKARVRIRVSFRPDGGDHAATRRRLVVLIKKKPRKKRRAKNRRATKPRTR